MFSSRQSTDPHGADNHSSGLPSKEMKTPRRVQWASKDDVRSTADLPTHPNTHTLDEMGLDPSAFETLRGALEQHESSDGGAQDLDTSAIPPPQHLTHTTVTTTKNDDTPANDQFRSSFKTPTRHYSSSNTDTPGTNTSPSTDTEVSTSGAGTPFSDTPLLVQRTHNVPGEVWIDHFETEGLPTRPTPLGVNLGVGLGVSDSDSASSRNATADRSGPETTGSSNLTRNRSRFGRRTSVLTRGTLDTTSVDREVERHIEQLAARRAASVVRAHTRRGRNSMRPPSLNRTRGRLGIHQSRTRTRDDQQDVAMHSKRRLEATEEDTEQSRSSAPTQQPVNKTRKKSWFHSLIDRTVRTSDSDGHDPESHTNISSGGHSHGHHRLGTGVLSALLTLYGNDNDQENDDFQEKGHEMEGEQDKESSHSDDEDDEDELEKYDKPRDDKRHSDSKGKAKFACKDVAVPRPSRTSLGRTHKSGSVPSLVSHLPNSLLPPTHSHPPSTIAALVAEAGSFRCAAAPAAATLGPNLKRGLGVVRYQVDAPNKDGAESMERLKDGKGECSSDVIATPSSSESPGACSATSGQEGMVSSHPNPGGMGMKRNWAKSLRDLSGPMHPISADAEQVSATAPAGWKYLSRSLPGTPHPLDKQGYPATDGSGSATPSLGANTPKILETPDEYTKMDYFTDSWDENEKQKYKLREQKKTKRRREKKKKGMKEAEIWITRHVAAILQRQEFILKLARAMMMFGGPSHRLVAQIHSTGRVLELELNCMYLPDVMLISFEDSATGTSNVKFIRQGSALDLEKLGAAHSLYWKVIHDSISVSQASAALDDLMCRKPLYSFTQLILIGAMCSASICTVSFSGSFIDALVSAPLGALLVTVQLLSPRNELYGNVFEITIATVMSFVSAALASTKHFCFSAVASSSVVLILPGFIVLCGSLEISSRSLVAGAVRLCFALMYSLFLAFGLSIGAQVYQKMIGEAIVGSTDYTCVFSHDPTGPWWQQTPSLWWAFLTVPLYSLSLSLRLMAPWWKKELMVLIMIACIGWVTNHFVSLRFPNQSDISAAVGAFAVGFVSNMYGRFFNGNAFVVMITGILFQVPSGLGNGGLLNFVSDQTAGSSSSYLSGFQTALQLISVAVGLTVGLGISLVVVHPVQSRKRAGGVFSL